MHLDWHCDQSHLLGYIWVSGVSDVSEVSGVSVIRGVRGVRVISGVRVANGLVVGLEQGRKIDQLVRLLYN